MGPVIGEKASPAVLQNRNVVFPGSDHTPFSDPPFSDLELGFHQQDGLPIPGEYPANRRDKKFQGNKRGVGDNEVGDFPEILRGKRPGVGPFHDHDSSVIPQRPRELTIPHVHRVHLPGPSFEKHLGKPPGGGSDINAY